MRINRSKPAYEPDPEAVNSSTASTSRSATVNLLPEDYSEPIEDVSNAIFLIHGERKIGKTSLASKFPGALSIMFEPGGRGLRLQKIDVTSWKMFTSAVNQVIVSDRFPLVILDTIDKAYEMCLDHVCQEEGVDYPSDGAYGQVWKHIEKEINEQVDKLVKSGRGVMFISHTEVRPIQNRHGVVYDKMMPSAAKAARKIASSIADIIGYYCYVGDDRFLIIQGNETLEAGHRFEERFLTTSGERVVGIPMGRSAQEAYDNIVKAFNNQQETDGKPETEIRLNERQLSLDELKRVKSRR